MNLCEPMREADWPLVAAIDRAGIADGRAGDAAGAGCCRGPAPAGTDACCVQDADAKAAGQDGCGCGVHATEAAAPVITAGACGG